MTIPDAEGRTYTRNSPKPGRFSLSKILILLILNLLSYSATSTASDSLSAAAANDTSKTRTVAFSALPIKYLDQNEEGKSSWCLAYSAAMLLSHYDLKVEPDVMARDLGLGRRRQSRYKEKMFSSDETSLEKLIQTKYNLKTQKATFVTFQDSTEAWLRRNLRQKKPVLMTYGRDEGHAVVLVGYDEEYVFMNDPSGAFFTEASELFGRNSEPKTWLSGERTSRYQGAGVKWEDFRTFICERSLWGCMIAVTKQ